MGGTSDYSVHVEALAAGSATPDQRASASASIERLRPQKTGSPQTQLASRDNLLLPLPPGNSGSLRDSWGHAVGTAPCLCNRVGGARGQGVGSQRDTSLGPHGALCARWESGGQEACHPEVV